MTVNDRFNEIIDSLFKGNKSAFAAAVGITPSVVDNIVGKRHGKPSFGVILKVSAIADINIEWLITGKGDMLKDAPSGYKEPDASVSMAREPEAAFAKATGKTPGAIPLVSEKAVGGFANEYFSIKESDVMSYYVIPKFRFLGVSFMIELTGDSMIPKFYPGDIIACSIIHSPKFIEWNKCHLLATVDRGLIVKRLMPGDSKDCLKIISDNKDYPPQDIPKDEITGIARVVGAIHLE